MPTFEDLKALPQWVVWKYETRDGKKTKVPYQTNGHRASSTDAATWTTHDAAQAAYEASKGGFAGVGFVFTPDDPYCGIDFDKCFVDGVLAEWAEEILQTLLPTYAEISPSGTGVKLWIVATLPTQADGKKRHKKTGFANGGAVEMYDAERFFTVTGSEYGGTHTIENRQEQVESLVAKLWPPAAPVSLQGAGQSISLDDHKIIELVSKASNAEKFRRLMAGDIAQHNNDQSSADLALVSMLAFYTQDQAQIDRIFRSSGLMREKWEREDYRQRTISKALAGLTETYKASGAGKEFDGNWSFNAAEGFDPSPAAGRIAALAEPEIHTTARPRLNGHQAAAAAPSVDGHANGAVQRILAGPPPYKPFPIDVLPKPLADYCIAAANAKSVPVEYIVLPMLAAMGAAIGISRQIEVKRDWKEYPTLWTCILGRTGTNKSGALSAASHVNRRRNKKAYEDWMDAQKKYEDELVEYEAAKKRKDTSVQKPEQPIAQQYVAGDTTIEALIMVLKNNPRGLLVMNDELSAWFKSFGAYKQGRGGDREHWLSLYSSKEFTVNRKMGDARYIHVDSAVICIAGGTQPSIINELLSKDMYESGMASRFIFCYPPEIPNHFNIEDVPENLTQHLERYVGGLFNLRPAKDMNNKDLPQVIPMSPGAQSVWTVWHNNNSNELLSMEDKYRAVWGKAPSHAARIALILHLLDQLDGQPWATTGEIEPPTIGRAHLLTDWAKQEQRRIYMTLTYTPDQQNAQQIIDHLIDSGGQCAVRDVYRRHYKFRDKELLDSTIALLEKAGIVGFTYDKSTEDGGRPSKILRLLAVPRDAKREWIYE